MSIANDTDRDWELWGKTDPYYGVLSAPQFLNTNLQEDSLRAFFRSGDEHVDHVYKTIERVIDPGLSPERVLDYGCGVGRLVIPFAHRSKHVVGVDVSPSMLKLARENCVKSGANSVRLIHVAELENLPSNSFDLIHSVLVFQHIPVDRGERIFKKLLSLLAGGGVGAIHLTYCDVRNPVRRSLAILHRRIGFLHSLLNLVRGQSHDADEQLFPEPYFQNAAGLRLFQTAY